VCVTYGYWQDPMDPSHAGFSKFNSEQRHARVDILIIINNCPGATDDGIQPRISVARVLINVENSENNKNDNDRP